MSVVHQVKRIQFLNQQVPICLQNENGPCPLLALVNVLLLRGTLTMHEDRSEITSAQLIELVGNYILEKNPTVEGNQHQAILSKTIEDVIELLPTLQHGLDVNVRFSGISDFEFDSRISVFDLLDVHLYHGWVLDKNDDNYALIGPNSYNQLVDKLVTCRDTEGQESSEAVVEKLHQAELIQKFLDDTASQLTFTGFVQLHEQVKERQLCAFFRNNHFSTMFKLDGKLYLLVTDQGYKDNNTIAWELLNDIDGNTEMVSPSFGDPNEYLHPRDLVQGGEEGKLDADRLLAMQIHDEEMQEQQRNARRTRQRQGGESKGNCVVS